MSEAAVKVPLRERINFRMIIFAAVVALMVGYPAWVYIDSVVSGGVHQGSDGYAKVDLKAMSNFSFDQNIGRLEDIPKQWRDLNGKKVIIEGEIAPTTFAANTLSAFDLCYSVQKCCFSGPPQVQHFVQSQLPDGEKAPFLSGFVRVKGVLHVNVKEDTGKVASIYQLDVESVEPVM